MPITNTTQIVHTIDSVVVHFGGAIDVAIRTTVTGFPDTTKTFSISEADALPYWGSIPNGTVNRWEDFCGVLYGVLMTRGDVVGTLS